MKRAFAVGSYVGVLLAFSYTGHAYGGLYWVPLFVMFIPAVVVGAGVIYGAVSGTGDVNSLDDSVSKGLEYTDDYEPEEEYDHD